MKNKIYIIALFLCFFVSCMYCSSNDNFFNNYYNENITMENVNTSLTEEEIEGNVEAPEEIETHKLLLTNTQEEIIIVNKYYYIMMELSSDDINYEKIESIYLDSKLQNLIEKLDNYYKSSINKKIKNYIKLGIKSSKTNYFDKLILITLTKVIKNTVFFEIEQLENDEIFNNKSSVGAPNVWDKAYIFFSVMYPLIESAYRYIEKEDISTESLEKAFINGSIFAYNKDNNSKMMLFIESQRIRKKILKIFFINMLKYVDLIISEKEKENINFDNVLVNLVMARGYYEIFSERLGNKKVKTFITKEISKTFTINRDFILSFTILYIFYMELEKNLDKSILYFDYEINELMLKLVWEAYFYYTIYEFDFEERMGKEKSEILKDEWIYLITVTKLSDKTKMEVSIEKIKNILKEYNILLEKLSSN